MIRFRNKGIFVVGFWWLWNISDLLLILTTSLTNLVCPKRFPILVLVCLGHYSQLRLIYLPHQAKILAQLPSP
jgi:hypothetical protein